MDAVVMEIYLPCDQQHNRHYDNPVYDGQSIHDYRFMQSQNKITIA